MNQFIYSTLGGLLLVGLVYGNPTEETQSTDDDSCNCGQSFSSRIIGGERAELEEIPWRLSLFIVRKNESRGSMCGGTIIDKHWAMTAAHCVDQMTRKGNKPSDFYVLIGSGSTIRYDGRNGTLHLLTGNNVIIHPNWNRTIVSNDIALIRVPHGFNFTRPNTERVCLPFRFKNATLKDQQVLASGWGRTSNEANSTSDNLLKVVLDMMEYEECNEKFEEMKLSNRIDENKFCCKSPEKDICQGDSGGSIDYLYEGRYYGFGIVSYVLGYCANPRGASVLTRVAEYLDWIEGITGADFCKA